MNKKLKLALLLNLFISSSFANELVCRMDEKGRYHALTGKTYNPQMLKEGLKVVQQRKQDDYFDVSSIASVFGFYYIDDHSLEAKYCNRLFNSQDRFKNLFNRDVGVPANELGNNELYVLDNSKVEKVKFFKSSNLKKYQLLGVSEDGGQPFDQFYRSESDAYTREVMRNYTNGLEGLNSIDEKFISDGVDWESFLELNIKGQKLWQYVVDRSRELNDKYPEEEARFNYFNQKRFVKDKKEHQKITEKIVDYKKEVFNFLDSSEMKVNYGLTKMSSFDPFFIQVIIEFFVSTNIYTMFDKKAILKNDFTVESKIIERNLYPDRINKVDYYDEDKLEEIQKRFYYKSNIIPIMSMAFSKSGCNHLGLRPELSRTIIQSFNPLLFSSFARGQFESMKANNALNCGSVEFLQFKSTHSIVYSNASKMLKDIIERYRELSYLKFKY